MTEICTVVRDNGKTAVIELVRTSKCDGCNACAFNKRNSLRMPAVKDVDCKAGDVVAVTMPEAEIRSAPLFLFVIPILLTLAAVLISRTFAPWAQAVLIVGFLAFGIVILFVVDKLFRRQRKYMPVITQVTVPAPKIQGENHD